MERIEEEQANPFFLISPLFIFIITILAIPMVSVTWFSFTDYNPILKTDSFVGLANYVNLFYDARLWLSIQITVIIVAAAGAIEFFLGLVLAALVDITGSRMRRYIVGILLLPMILTPVVVGFIWMYMFFDYGPLNGALESVFGFSVQWVGSWPLALIAIIITDIWEWTPFMFLIILAALQSMPLDPVEAAEIDGASRWQMWRYVKLPLLKGVILIAVVLRGMDLFKIFDIISIITRGGPSGDLTQSLTYYLYNIGLNTTYNLGYTSAISMLLLLVLSTVIARVYGLIRVE